MTGTNNGAVAVRNGSAPEQQQTGALAIYADQIEWTSMQEAALNQLGLRNASDGDRMVFLHQAQRTGLDPFSKQIHMIERGGKWGIQTGIDGYRVMRARAERKAGVRGILGRPIFYDGEGNEYKVWFRPQPPVACEITYTVKDATGETPYTSILRFTEYAQYKQDGKLTQKWLQSAAHMLEKCTEADVYRKAFPQDFSGVDLSDAPPLPDDDTPPARPERQRVTAAAARERRPQTVTAVATTVTPDAASGDSATPAPPEAAQPETLGADSPNTVTAPQLKAIWTILRQVYGYTEAEKDKARDVCARIIDHELATTTMLSQDEAGNILDRLDQIRREAAEAAASPREYLDLMTAPQAAQDGADGE